MKPQASTFSFLQGGGEMGELTRNYDWSKTSLGTPDQWPQSLRTVVNIILNSRFPQFIWWGEELIQFYNDAYRPSFGNHGKHPKALGQTGEECWPEIWPTIKPLIDQVLAGDGATWSEDQLIPIYRNGQMEDVYWTFGYSPVNDESGNIAAVLVTCAETTDKVINLKKLQDSEDQLRFAIEATDLGLWDYNPQTNYFTGNKRLKEWFGLLQDDEIDLTLAINVIAKEDQARVTEAIQTALQYSSGGSYDTEYTIINPKTKVPRIVSAKGRAWFNEEKIAYRFNGTLQDVTAQVIERRKTQESEARFRSLIEEAPYATALYVGRELIIETANQPIINIWGKDSSVIGKQLHIALPELEGQDFLKILDDVYTTGIPYFSPGSIVKMIVNGVLTTAHYSFIYKPLRNQQGDVFAILNMAVDVTGQVVARQKIEEAEASLRGAIELAELATWSLNIEKQTFSYSPRFMEWLGFTEETKNLDEAYNPLPEEFKQQVIDAIAAAVAPGSTGIYDNEHPIINRVTGQVRIIHAHAQVFYDHENKITVLSGTAQDITEQKSLLTELEKMVQERTEELASANEELQSANEETTATNEELSEANQKLSQSNRQLEQYAYVASHDLQEPLRKIRTFTDRLIHQKDLSGNSIILGNKINQSAERMSKLIFDLLEFSRLNEANALRKAVDLTEVVTNVITDFEIAVEERDSIIHVGDLPTIQAVGLQMNQLFYNLISNALKFSKKDISPRINVDSKRMSYEEVKNFLPHPLPASNYYQITFSDNGIGFEAQYAEHIFEIFKRLHTRDEYPGSGIGLALCRRIVLNHNGYMYAKSEPGKGTTFRIILPDSSSTLNI